MSNLPLIKVSINYFITKGITSDIYNVDPKAYLEYCKQENLDPLSEDTVGEYCGNIIYADDSSTDAYDCEYEDTDAEELFDKVRELIEEDNEISNNS